MLDILDYALEFRERAIANGMSHEDMIAELRREYDRRKEAIELEKQKLKPLNDELRVLDHALTRPQQAAYWGFHGEPIDNANIPPRMWEIRDEKNEISLNIDIWRRACETLSKSIVDMGGST